MRRTLEATCWLRLGRWSNNVADSHPSPGSFNSILVLPCLVQQCSYPPNWPCCQRRLVNCDWIPAPCTSGQSSYSRRHPAYWTSSQWSHTVSSTPCHGALTSAPLSAHLSIEWECTASQIETPISYPLLNSLWVHLTTKSEGWNADKLECTTRLRTLLPDPPSWNGTAENSVQ